MLTQQPRVIPVKPGRVAGETLDNPITSVSTAALDKTLLRCINLLNMKQILSGQSSGEGYRAPLYLKTLCNTFCPCHWLCYALIKLI